MTRLFYYCFICLILTLNGVDLRAQTLDHVQGELLVKFEHQIDASQLMQSINNWRNSYQFEGHKVLVKAMNIHVISFDHTLFDERQMISILQHQPGVEIVQFNHLIEWRATVPNDPLFNSQWQYINTGQLPNGVFNADLDIDLAWDITTGGVTPLGDTIVVCVIDDGLNPNHIDFGDNLWCNHHEISGNNIDDDNNGYIDDTKGWDTYDLDGNPLSTDAGDWHGTPVAGIVGARGDNSIGVTGVNWNVKIMMVRGGGSEANAVASYSYPLAQRKLYNESNGAFGAFVVATNASWGTNQGQPAGSPLWCAIYDSLGQQGVLNAGATANENFNVDVVGDLPTACPSEYLIAVTNLDETDQKVTRAGFGSESIDLGAYGENTFTVATPNGYDEFGGTSGASPHVAGAIGLLYSAPCNALANLYKVDPAAAARLVRSSILTGTTPNTSLQGITVTEGRLNINGALLALLEECGPCPTLKSLSVGTVKASSIELAWTSNDSIISVEIQYRETGALDWNTEITTGEAYQISNLSVCSTYEIRARGLCASDSTAYLNINAIQTDGCCDDPLNIEISNISETSFDVEWDGVTASSSYLTRIRELGSPSWDENVISVPNYHFAGLTPCTSYEFQLQTTCADSSSDFTIPIPIVTPGCGSCLDFTYCTAIGGDSENDFIDIFTFEAFTHTTGDDSGYGDYTSVVLPHAERQKNYPVALRPGYTGIALNEFYCIWIDFNADGEFSSDEKVLDLNSSDTSGVSSDIVIPSDAILGATRMRLGMRFSRSPNVCDDSESIFGEYEDYCLTIDENSGVIISEGNELEMKTFPNPVYDHLILQVNDYSIARGLLTIFDQSGKTIRKQHIDLFQNDEKTLDLSEYAAGVYILQFQVENSPLIFVEKIIKL